MSKKKKNLKKIGLCKLTNTPGVFVESHIIPQAFLPKIIGDEPFHQPMDYGRYKKYWTGWYDQELVIRKGEDILSDLDSWAASTLRSHGLVWGSPNNKKLIIQSENIVFQDSEDKIRKISNIDTKKLRMFCISLLWRSAASTLSEFNDIQLSSQALERLRRILTNEEPDSTLFYPCTMIQLSSSKKDDTHATTPFKDNLTIKLNSGKLKLIPYYRFYFNGLIINYYDCAEDYFGKLVIGTNDDLYVFVKNYHASREKQIYRELLDDHINEYIKFKKSEQFIRRRTR